MRFVCLAVLALVVPASLAVAQDGGDSDAGIGQWIEDLGDTVPSVRERATESLKSLGAPAKSALLAAREDPDPEVRARAKLILETIRDRVYSNLGEILSEGVSDETRERLERAHMPGCLKGPTVPLSTVAALLEETKGVEIVCSGKMKASEQAVDANLLMYAYDVGDMLERLAQHAGIVHAEHDGRIQVSLASEVVRDPATLDILIEELAQGEEWNAVYAIEILRWNTGRDFGFDYAAPFAEERSKVARGFRGWLDSNRARLRWDERSERLVED